MNDALNQQLALSYQTAMQATASAKERGLDDIANLLQDASKELSEALTEFLKATQETV